MSLGPPKIIDRLTGEHHPIEKVRSFGRSESLDDARRHPDTEAIRKQLFISPTTLRDAQKGRLFGLIDGEWVPIEVHRAGQSPRS